jgi:hypothetical protein
MLPDIIGTVERLGFDIGESSQTSTPSWILRERERERERGKRKLKELRKCTGY